MKFWNTKVLIVLILVLSFTNLSAQKLSPGPQVLTFHSDADDTEQPYGLYLPKNFDENKKYPLVIMLHGAGSNHRLALKRVFGKTNAEGETDVEASRYFQPWEDVDFIVASPYARGTAGYQGIPEEDVYDVLDDVKKRFKIDENRTYLTGLSMGGGGTLWIGLTRPDIWAAIAPVCPAPPEGTFDLASNALNFPIHFFHGDADPVVPVAGTRKWVQHLQDIGVEVSYKEFVDVKHDSWVSAYDNEFIFEWFGHAERNPFPNRVKFVSKQYKYNKAFWVQFDKMNLGTLAEIDANLNKPNAATITTKNLSAFTVNLKGHPKFNAATNVSFTIDGKALTAKLDSSISFVKNNNVWAVATSPIAIGIVKKKGAEGPIYEAFSSRHIYVYGTADNPSPEELKKRTDLATQAADWSHYRGEFLGRIMFFPRVLSDKEVRESDIESSNLILFGTKETNAMIAKYADKLPVHLSPADKAHGLLYVFPMDKHYVAVSSGLPWWSGAEDKGFPFVSVMHRRLPEFKDLFFFKDSSTNLIVNGNFSDDWQVTEDMKAKLSGSGAITITK
ncbi:alpha/beta hydrolase-fold protein [Dyadobacter chenwenxiniae]|uniref:Phospholipase n=1 Tax=Dyadobacter chenwenxiniae TaxID=2906456 RepID=A0A9X1PGP1_9BACT|nr:alpha/beta hydrolase-fold protein [Dyadobacter chenwenxiniae]MCF0060872.1 phospholipase [Dyadobacter chenwenxiniae]UON80699.1 alpha/beta hydrolase-fold protein [Dyadobacter chenwenxiniae]